MDWGGMADAATLFPPFPGRKTGTSLFYQATARYGNCSTRSIPAV